MRQAKLVSLALGTALLFTVASASAQAPAPPPAYGMPITLEQAKKVMAGAEAEAKKNNWPVVIVILDSGGQLVMVQRLDNAQWGSADIAKEKARSAVALRRPTKALAGRDRAGWRQPPVFEHRLQRARRRHPDRRRRQDHRLRRRLRRHSPTRTRRPPRPASTR